MRVPECLRAIGGAGGAVLVLAIAVLGCMLPTRAHAQYRTALGIRGGAGLAPGGEMVYAGQIELVDMEGTSSVELALTAWSRLRVTGEYGAGNVDPDYEYPERLETWGGALVVNYLWRHARSASGPYAVFGIGVGPIWVDWRADSADPLFGTTLGTGSFRHEEYLSVGTALSLGIGQRLHDRLDVRAQVMTVVVPSTEAREDMRLVPLLALTSGVGF